MEADPRGLDMLLPGPWESGKCSFDFCEIPRGGASTVRMFGAQLLYREIRCVGTPDRRHLPGSALAALSTGLIDLRLDRWRLGNVAIGRTKKRADSEYLIHALEPNRAREFFLAQCVEQAPRETTPLLVSHAFRLVVWGVPISLQLNLAVITGHHKHRVLHCKSGNTGRA